MPPVKRSIPTFVLVSEAFSRIKRTLGRWLLKGRDALENITPVFDPLNRNLVHKTTDRSHLRPSLKSFIFHTLTKLQHDHVLIC